MKKKILSIVIITILISMLFTLTGCGNEKTAGEETSNNNQEAVTQTGNLNLEVQSIGDFSCGLARIKKNGKWGYINTLGDIVIECSYDDAQDFSEELAAVQKDEKWGFIDTNGNVIVSFQYKKVTDFKGGMAGVQDGKLGFIDKTGKALTELKYRNAVPIGNGLGYVDGMTSGFDGGYAIIDSKGKIIVNDCFASVGYCNSNLIPVKQIKVDGKLTMEKGKYGYIDKNGTMVIDYQYDSAYPFTDGIAMVEKDGKLGIINSTGNVVEDIIYKNSTNMVTVDFSQDLNGMMELYDGNKSIYINKNGKQIELETGIKAYNFCNGFARVKKDDKYGYINTDGKVVIDYKYYSADDFSSGLAKTYMDDGYENFEFINANGKTIIAGKIIK